MDGKIVKKKQTIENLIILFIYFSHFQKNNRQNKAIESAIYYALDKDKIKNLEDCSTEQIFATHIMSLVGDVFLSYSSVHMNNISSVVKLDQSTVTETATKNVYRVKL